MSAWEAVRIMFDRVGLVAFPDNDELSLFYPTEDPMTELLFVSKFVGFMLWLFVVRWGWWYFQLKVNALILLICFIQKIL